MNTKFFLFVTTCLISSHSFAASQPWLIRARAIDVVPYASSNSINAVGGHVNTISTQIVPEIDISYFFTPHISAELILATSRHAVTATGTSLGKVDLGKVNVLPPTLNLQYHFTPNPIVSPYVGAGINYTYFYNVKNGPVANSTSYGNSVGPALQLGMDVAIDQHWLINLDYKKVYIESKVRVNTAIGQLTPTVKLNPSILGLGVGYRF